MGGASPFLIVQQIRYKYGKHCALFEKSMKFSGVFVHTMETIFRRGGILDNGSEPCETSMTLDDKKNSVFCYFIAMYS